MTALVDVGCVVTKRNAPYMIDTMARSARPKGDRYSSNMVRRASHSDRNHYATSSQALMQDISGYPLDF